MGGRYQITQVALRACWRAGAGAAPLGFAAASVKSDSDGVSRFSPGVLGAPKEAKAPEPRPNAEEAFVEGEETPPPERGDRALKGFDRPWELSGPNRLDERGSSTLAPPSLPSVPVMDRDNLEELQGHVHG